MRRSIGNKALYWAIALSVAMLAATLLLMPVPSIASDFGICLPSPNLWPLRYPADWILNSALLFIIIAAVFFCNKHFNFVQGNGLTLPIVLMTLLAGNPFISRVFCSSTLLLGAVTLCLWILFGTWEKRNATQDYFTVATIMSLGSMMQYAFIPMTAAMIAAGALLKSLRLKETLAFLLGLVAPYWVAVGLGLVPLTAFHLPTLDNIFHAGPAASPDFFLMLAGTGLLFVFCALLNATDAVRLYAGNSRIRCMNSAISSIGYVAALCMLLDYNNLLAYAGILYLWMAVQAGNLFALHRLHRPNLLLLILGILYAALYTAIIILQ